MNLALAFIGSIIGLGTMILAFYHNAKYKHKQRQKDETIRAHRRVNSYIANKN